MKTVINYQNKKFQILSSSENGEISNSMVFHYKQEGNILSSSYTDTSILKGHLLGTVEEDGTIQMKYHQINSKGELMTGECTSTPEILENGKIRLHEKWKWTSGDFSEGSSTLEEI